MNKVLCFGEPMALFIAEEEGPLEDVVKFHKSLAGAELNVCIGLVRLGHKVSYVTRLGDEPLGWYIKKFLKKEGIGTEYVTFDSEYNTGFQLKKPVSEGDPYVVNYRKGSAFSHFPSSEIENIDFSDVKIIHITGIPPALSLNCREATFRLIEKAKEHNLFITFDPNLRPMLWESEETMIKTINEIASQCDLILPGLKEGEVLTGKTTPEEIADFYLEMGVEGVIVKLGDKGAYAKVGSQTYYHPGFKVTVVDTVGAGDGFACGIISGKLEGLSLEEAVIRGNAIGAIQVTSISDNEGLPTREELNQFLQRYSR